MRILSLSRTINRARFLTITEAMKNRDPTVMADRSQRISKLLQSMAEGGLRIKVALFHRIMKKTFTIIKRLGIMGLRVDSGGSLTTVAALLKSTHQVMRIKPVRMGGPQ